MPVIFSSTIKKEHHYCSVSFIGMEFDMYHFKALFQRLHFNVYHIVLSTKERRRLKLGKGNVDLSTILRRCSEVLITALHYQQYNDVFPMS